MADRTIKVLTPATEIGFLTLAEAKLMLGITGVTDDEQLQFWIDVNSATIMRLCNRIMARERVQETWRDLQSRRVFLSHWPVVESDIESVISGDTVLGSGGWELEEQSGKLSNFDGWAEPITVIYTGGYDLPTGAPLPLKQATSLLVREARFSASVDSIAGIRSLGYAGKRVQFFDPTKVLTSGGGSTGRSPAQSAVGALLVHYTRWEV